MTNEATSEPRQFNYDYD